MGKASLDGAGGWRRRGWAIPLSVRALTQTHGQRPTPGAVGLTHGGLVSLNGHVGVAAEDDGRAESRPLIDIVQPPVGQMPRVSTVDLCNTPHLTLTLMPRSPPTTRLLVGKRGEDLA